MKILAYTNNIETGKIPEFVTRPGQVVVGTCETDQGAYTLLRGDDGTYFLEDHRARYEITKPGMMDRMIRRER